MNTAKNDKLDALLYLSAGILAELDSDYLNSLDTSDITISKAVDRRIRRRIQAEQRKQEYGALYLVFRRIAAVFLIVGTITLALAMSIEAVRAEFWNAIIDIFDDFIKITAVTETKSPTTIEVKKEPKYIPESYEKETVSDTSFVHRIQYYENNQLILTYCQKVLDNSAAAYDNDHLMTSSVTVHADKAILMYYYDDGRYSLTWTDGEYNYSLSSFDDRFTESDIISIAESVQ